METTDPEYLELKDFLVDIIDLVVLSENLSQGLNSIESTELCEGVGTDSKEKIVLNEKRPLQNFNDLLSEDLTDSEDEFPKKKGSKNPLWDDSESDNDNQDDEPEIPEDNENKSNKKPKPKSVKSKRKTLKDNVALKENLTAIHSESQRLLREKRFSLPYHKPKINNLRDFLKRKSTDSATVLRDENICSALIKTMRPDIRKTTLAENNLNTLETPLKQKLVLENEVEEDDDSNLPAFEDFFGATKTPVNTTLDKPKLSALKKKLISSMNKMQPKISGSPNSFIDLDSNVDQHAVEGFVQRFAKHTSIINAKKINAEQEVKIHIVSRDACTENSEQTKLKEEEIIVKVRPLCANSLISPNKTTNISSLRDKLWSKISERKRLTREEKKEAYDMDNEEGFEDEEEELETEDEEDDHENDNEDDRENDKEDDHEKDKEHLDINEESHSRKSISELDSTKDIDVSPLNNNSTDLKDKNTSFDSCFEMTNSLIPAHQPGGGLKYGINNKEEEEQWLKTQDFSKNRATWLSQSRSIPRQCSLEDSMHLILETDTFCEDSEKPISKLFTQKGVQAENLEFNELLNLCSGKFETDDDSEDDDIIETTKKNTGNRKTKPILESDSEDDDLEVGRKSNICKGINGFINDEAEDEDDKTGHEDSEEEEVGWKSKFSKSNKLCKSDLFINDEAEDDENEVDKTDGFINDESEDDENEVDNSDLEEGEDRIDDESDHEKGEDSDHEEMENKSDRKEEKGNKIQAVNSKVKAINEFFEEEAELSGSDIGSEDEDDDDNDQGVCKGLVNDDISDDEEELRKQVEREHLKWMINDDKKEVRFFKNAFLEDGDLHTDGEGRTRRFRWSNLNDSGDEENKEQSGDEADKSIAEENDEMWRKERYEREKWLHENSANENDGTVGVHKKFRISVGSVNRSFSKREETKEDNNDSYSSSFLIKNTDYLNSLSEKFTKQSSNNIGRRSTKNFVFVTSAVNESTKRPAEENISNLAPKKPKFNIRQKMFLNKPKAKNSVFDLL